MNSTEWNRIKNIRQSKGVIVHNRETHDIGRNKAKREARAKGLRHIGKAPRLSV